VTFKIISRKPFGVGVTLSAMALAAAVVGISDAGAKVTAHPAASTTPSAKVVAPAKKLNGVVLNVGDQAGTGAEAVLEAAKLINANGVLKDGLHVKWADFTSGPPILQAISSGALDIGGVGDAPPVFANPASKEVIVGVLKNSATNAALVVPANSPITSISQLAGKTVAVGTGTSANYHFLTVLQKAGLQPSQVTADNLSGAAGLEALQAGDVDALDTWSPFVEDAEAQGDRVIATGNAYGSPYSYQVASSAALKSPAKVLALRDYLTELDKAYAWVTTHKLYWAKAWASVTGLPLSVMSQATLDDPYTPIAVTSNAVVQEQGLVNAFAGSGEIPAKYNFAPYVTSAFSDSVTGVWPKATTTKKKKKK
jgi:sulfonate transport system substrate-binding protein